MLSKSDYDVASAIRLLNSFSVQAAYLVPTQVGLEKNILDAVAPLRAYLKAHGIHDYEKQGLGAQEAGRSVSAFYVMENDLRAVNASLYRPTTKNGDPRIWFSKLPTYAQPNNLLAIIAWHGCLYVVNFSIPSIRLSAHDPNSPLGAMLCDIKRAKTAVSNELLNKMRSVAQLGWVPTRTPGDTGIGITLEGLLGIATNSSKKPDYKGIEIKAKRINGLTAPTRSTLFAQVPTWDISNLKSSAAILDAYGYERDRSRKLYCTVKSKVPNSQGLMLWVDNTNDLLHEVHKSGDHLEPVVVWRFETLRSRLISKHAETFWVGAESKQLQGREHFLYRRILHTQRPFVDNFDTLCTQGIVTMDHLIKRDDSGKVVEKGPLFKIDQKNFDLLFPAPVIVDLL